MATEQDQGASIDRLEELTRRLEAVERQLERQAEALGQELRVLRSGWTTAEVYVRDSATGEFRPLGWHWKHLERRPHPWKRQPYLPGRNMTVRQLVGAIKANGLTVKQAAENFDLPEEAVAEAVQYAEENKWLLDYETQFERWLLQQKGYKLGPQSVPG